MGSDFCLAFIGIEKDKDPDWKKGEEFIEKLRSTHLSKWKDLFSELSPDSGFVPDMEHFCMKLDLPLDGYQNEQEPDMNDRVSACDRLLKCLDHIKMAWESGTRDSVVIQVGEKDFLFSGGMSWGDPPTDTYEEIHLFADSGLGNATGLKY